MLAKLSQSELWSHVWRHGVSVTVSARVSQSVSELGTVHPSVPQSVSQYAWQVPCGVHMFTCAAHGAACKIVMLDLSADWTWYSMDRLDMDNDYTTITIFIRLFVAYR